MRVSLPVSYDKERDGDIKAMLMRLKKEVQEYGGWSRASLAGSLLGAACREELRHRGIAISATSQNIKESKKFGKTQAQD